MRINYDDLENYTKQIYAVYDFNDGFGGGYFSSKKEAIQCVRKLKKVYIRRLCETDKDKIRARGENIIFVGRYNNYADYEKSVYSEIYSLVW